MAERVEAEKRKAPLSPFQEFKAQHLSRPINQGEERELDVLIYAGGEKVVNTDPMPPIARLEKFTSTFFSKVRPGAELSTLKSSISSEAEPQASQSLLQNPGIHTEHGLDLTLIKKERSQLPSTSKPGLTVKQLAGLHDPRKLRTGQIYGDPAPSKYKFGVPQHIKEQIIKKNKRPGNVLQMGREEPIVGFVAYVGSPVNGDVVIGNPKVVDEWLAYMRSALKRKLVKIEDGAITAPELGKLCNVTILPNGRHRFSIGYDTHPKIGCEGHLHNKHLWESETYPCAILSCACPKHGQFE